MQSFKEYLVIECLTLQTFCLPCHRRKCDSRQQAPHHSGDLKHKGHILLFLDFRIDWRWYVSQLLVNAVVPEVCVEWIWRTWRALFNCFPCTRQILGMPQLARDPVRVSVGYFETTFRLAKSLNNWETMLICFQLLLTLSVNGKSTSRQWPKWNVQRNSWRYSGICHIW